MQDESGSLPPENDSLGLPSSSTGRRHGRRRNQAVPKRRRWLKRTLIGLGSLVVLAAALGGAGWFYLNYRLDQIPKIGSVGNLKKETPGAPINVLLVGSDSRAWCETAACWAHFGNESKAGGQRSDVIIIIRLVPAERKMEMLSIPRDTWVNIANSGGQQNRINAAFNFGPTQLIATIEDDFHIPINHFAYTTFPGFTDAVTALGGVYLNFPNRLMDDNSGLHIRKTGCQFVNGQTALELVRSRDLSYYANGQWNYDGLGDLSRIRRQQAFFHAVLQRANSDWNIFQLNSFIGKIVNDVAVDQTWRVSELRSLALEFRGIASSALSTQVLPTKGAVYGGADILLPAWNYDRLMVAKFLAFGGRTSKSGGLAVPTSSTTPTTTQPLDVTGTTTGPIFDNSKIYPEPWNPTPCNP